MQIVKQFHQPTVAQTEAIRQIPFRQCPSFLGSFSMACYGPKYGRGNVMPKVLDEVFIEMANQLPDQQFNAAFVQRYRLGEQVLAHRDPKNNVGHTLILVLGDFEGATSTIDGYDPVQLKHGDLLSLECTINGKQGPRHSVSPVTRGTRYALILNTIV